MDKYKLITILELNDGMPCKINVTRESGKNESIESESACFNAISEFAKQESMSLADLFSDRSKVINSHLKEEKVEKEVKIKEKIEEKDLEPVSASVSELKEEKTTTKKKGKWGIAVTSIAVAAVLTLSGVGLYKLGKKSGYAGKSYTLGITTYGNPLENEFNNNLNALFNNSQEVISGLTEVNQGTSASMDDYLISLSDQAMITTSNMYEISEYVNGNELVGDAYYYDLKNIYDENSYEYYAVEYFCGLRNKVLLSAYEEKNLEKTKENINNFFDKFISFVYAGNHFQYQDGNENIPYGFSDLSPMGKGTIIDIGLGMLNIEQDFDFEYDGVQYDRNKTMNLTNTLYSDVMGYLEDKNFSR